MARRWGVHACALDPICRRLGVRRLHLFTPWGALILAIGRDNWTQTRLPRLGRRWSPVAWQPRSKGAPG